MQKECNVYLLPHTEGGIILGVDITTNIPGSMRGDKFHLYITDDSKIKEGDYFLSLFNSYTLYNIEGGYEEYPDTSGCNKIIATTNTLRLITKDEFGGIDNQHLPKIPKQFIEHYISEYNKGNKIEKVLVRFSDVHLGQLVLENNEIIIKPAEEKMYSKEEVIKLLTKCYFDAVRNTGEGKNGEYCNGNNPVIEDKFKFVKDNWLKENLK